MGTSSAHGAHDAQDFVYARSPDVLWRLGPDRVLVRRVDVPDGRAQDLTSAAALVWIALDEPGTTTDVVTRLVGAGLEAGAAAVADAIRLLLAEQLLVVEQGEQLDDSGGGLTP